MSDTTIDFTWRVDGELTDVTSVVLSDEGATYGVKRSDTDEVVVAAGTALEKIATGTYRYSFADPAANLDYEYWLEVVYNGATYRHDRNISAGVDDNEAASAAIAATLTGMPGVKRITVDGQTVELDPAGALEQMKYFDRKAAVAAGRRPRTSSINLGGY